MPNNLSSQPSLCPTPLQKQSVKETQSRKQAQKPIRDSTF